MTASAVTSSRLRSLTLFALLLSVLTACAEPTPVGLTSDRARGVTPSPSSSGPPTASGEPTKTPSVSRPPAGSTTPSPTGSTPSPTTSPTPTISVKVVLTPACVRVGGQVQIDVSTLPDSQVGYQAYYADGNSGADAPFGKGYGGNAGDRVDANGHYRATWIVKPNAPVGAGRVQVLAANKAGYSNTFTPFRVVAAEGSCS